MVQRRHFRHFGVRITPWLFIMGINGCDSPVGTTDAPIPPTLPDLPSNVLEGLTPPEEWLGSFISLIPPDLIHSADLSSMGSADRATTSVHFVDLDGDGVREWISASEGCCAAEEGLSPLYVWNSDAREWTQKEPLASYVQPKSQGLTGVLDVDGDQTLDLVYTNPEGLIAWGTGAGAFGAPTVNAESVSKVTGGLVQVVDVDRDGLYDLIVGDHLCLPDTEGPALNVLYQRGRRQWEYKKETFPVTLVPGLFYGVLSLPPTLFPNTLFLLGLPCSQENPHDAFLVETGRDSDGDPVFQGIDPTEPDAAFKATPQLSFGPISRAHPMGVAVADINLDGNLDIGTTLDYRHLLLLGSDDGIYHELPPASGFKTATIPDDSATVYEIGWGLGIADLDGDGREDIVVANGPTAPSDPRYNTGVTFFWNGGDSGFARVQELSTTFQSGEWRGLMISDVDEDGDPDVLVGGVGNPPMLILNDFSPSPRTASVALEGTLSPPHAHGAVIYWKTTEGLQRMVVVGNAASPTMQAIPEAFIPLESGEDELEIEIHWPSGLQSRESIKAGAHFRFREPLVVELSPFSRMLDADGKSKGEVRIVAQEGETEPVPRLFEWNGSERKEHPLELKTGYYSHQWTAGTSPRVRRFEVEFRGQPLTIQPKVFERTPED